MIFEFVFKQLSGRRRVRGALRCRDHFTEDYRKFLRLVRSIDRDNLEVSTAVRKRIEAILKDNKLAISFRLMSRTERKIAGCGPRMIAESSAEMKKLINLVERARTKTPAERKEESDKRARVNRAAMGLGR